MTDLQQLLQSITPEIYQRLKLAVELGKWPNGERLSPEQLELTMQGVIAYEHQHLPPEAHTGYIPPKPHQHCGSDGTDAVAHDPNASQTIKWR
jgi:uncharacterized protein YeaC (DUF1315 family)